MVFNGNTKSFRGKKSAGYCRLYPPTPIIPIISELQRGTYLGRGSVNLNSDTAALSQSLRPAKMLADLLPWELTFGDCDHKNAMKSKDLGVSFLFPMRRDNVPQTQQAKISSLTWIPEKLPTEIHHSSPALEVCADANGSFRCHREPDLSSSTLVLTTGQGGLWK